MSAAVNSEREVRGEWRRRGWAQRLPLGMQQSLRRLYYGWQIRTGRFASDEADYRCLDQFVKPGDQVIDVGANLGTYTLRLAELVGAAGHVFAFEPVSETFEILASNVRLTPNRNITLFRAAVSARCGLARLDVPNEQLGFAAHYFARIIPGGSGAGCEVYCCSLDSLGIPGPVSLVKIDVEGHEAEVLKGMTGLLELDRPTLIVEGDSAEVDELLEPLGYESRRLRGSQNRIFARQGVLEGIAT